VMVETQAQAVKKKRAAMEAVMVETQAQAVKKKRAAMEAVMVETQAQAVKKKRAVMVETQAQAAKILVLNQWIVQNLIYHLLLQKPKDLAYYPLLFNLLA